MSDLTCSSCQHFFALTTQCRRNPPVPVIIGQDSTGAPAVAGMWPAASNADWCGEFHRMPIPTDEGMQ